MLQMTKKRLTTLVVIMGVLMAGSASALSENPTILFDIEGGDASRDIHDYGTGVLDYRVDKLGESYEVYEWKLDNQLTLEGVRIESWEIELKEDPYVISNMYVTNTTTTDQVFIVGTLLAIPAFAYNEVVYSSLGVTATDSNADGNLYFNHIGSGANQEVYDGQVNGLTELAMDPDSPWTLPLTVADCGGPGCSAVSSRYVASKPVTGGVATSIGLDYRFILSPGDSAAVTGRFEIIPEPGTGLLLALGLVGLGQI